MIILILLIVVVLLITISWMNTLKECKRYNIPGPTPYPLVGNALIFLGEPERFLVALKELFDEYGNILRVHLLSTPYIVCRDTKILEALTSSNELITKGVSYTFLKPWLGEGLLTASGARWRTHRKFLTPAFHFNILQNYLPVFLKNEKILVSVLRRHVNAPVDLFPIIARAALDNVTESIMGVSVNAQSDSESKYVKAINDMSGVVASRMRNPLISNDNIYNFTLSKRIQDKSLQILKGQTNNVIEARRQELKRNNITELRLSSEHGIKNKYAFLDLLLLAEIEGEKISDESVKEEVETFMFEGYDTTTSGVVFCLYCLSNNEDVQKKILEEQHYIFGDNMDRDPTYSELQQMKYLEQVIKESFRLYPPVPVIQRMIERDIDIGEYHFLKGTSVLMDTFHMQRHPDLYEDPLEFRPERFESQNLKNPFHWLAFSAGPRNCIGQKFAMMEIKVTVAAIVKHFEILPTGIEPVLCADLILRGKNGVHVKFAPRS